MILKFCKYLRVLKCGLQDVLNPIEQMCMLNKSCCSYNVLTKVEWLSWIFRNFIHKQQNLGDKWKSYWYWNNKARVTTIEVVLWFIFPPILINTHIFVILRKWYGGQIFIYCLKCKLNIFADKSHLSKCESKFFIVYVYHYQLADALAYKLLIFGYYI